MYVYYSAHQRCLSSLMFLNMLCFFSVKASHLETETISYEEKELQLVNDCVKELREWLQSHDAQRHACHMMLSVT